MRVAWIFSPSTWRDFAAAITAENHTLKRALTDPRILSGIGNAYSDEILHAAQLSPVQLTSKLTSEQMERLFTATRETLQMWIDRLQAEAKNSFPEKVTAFRKDMAVHGRFGQPCPRCGKPVQRIRYADNETNYCAQCQTGGKVLADRSLSRLFGADWPRTLDELETLRRKIEDARTCPTQAKRWLEWATRSEWAPQAYFLKMLRSCARTTEIG